MPKTIFCPRSLLGPEYAVVVPKMILFSVTPCTAAADAVASPSPRCEGPFPTEFGPELMETIRQKGGEFGATTGRARRCGWFDALVVGHSVRINGLTSIAITKLDVLDDQPIVKIAVGYKYRGKIYRDFPENGQGGTDMWRTFLNRHNRATQGCFLDGSSRKIPLWTLWNIRWHREFRRQLHTADDFPFLR